MGPDQREFFKALGELVERDFDMPVIVNIGVLLGCSMCCFRAGSPSARIFGIDHNFTRRFPMRDALEFLQATFIEGDSGLLCHKFEHPIHLLLVDGGHSYGTVEHDISGWVPKIVPGGIVSFHDCHMGSVLIAVNEWRQSWSRPWREIKGPCPGILTFRKPLEEAK